MYISGSDLRYMRLKAGKTTVQMAEYAGVKSRKTYENWEKNRSKPNIDQLLDMASACNWHVTDLLQLATMRKISGLPLSMGDFMFKPGFK